MQLLLTLSLVAVGIGGFFLCCLNGRHDAPPMPQLLSACYAHRGLHDADKPENSLAAFRAAAEKGYGAELDVRLTKDGVPVVVHDTNLSRVTGLCARIDELTLSEVSALRLGDTDEPIPTLAQVLPLFEETAPLLIELKTNRNNAKALCKAVMPLLDNYHGLFALQSFDPRCLLWLKKHRPAVIRGQLTQNFHRSKDVCVPLRFLLTSLVFNVLTRPDYIAYRFDHRRQTAFAAAKRVWKMPCAYWTLTTPEDVALAKAEGAMPIFEGCEI